MKLATAALDTTAIATRVEALLIHRDRQRRRIELAAAERPCIACGASPTSPFPRGRLCADHAPPQPVGYCAPNRCYCRADSCQRPG